MYGAASCSYGNEPRRHVDLFRTDNTCFPSIRLSDAILTAAQPVGVSSVSASGSNGGGDGASLPPEGTRAARLGPAPGDPWVEGFTEHYSQGKWRKLELRFTDIYSASSASTGTRAAEGVDIVTGALREFSGEYSLELWKRGVTSAGGGGLGRWEEGDDLVAHFWRRAAFEQAVGKLGGGIRGRFRVRGTQVPGPECDSRDQPPPSGTAAAAAAAAAAAMSSAGGGGRVGPRVPGAFGRPTAGGSPSGKEEKNRAGAPDPWDDDEDEDDV